MKQRVLPPGGRGIRPQASSHDRILRAAKRLFATRGYEGTSTAAIARLAGTSESQLMKHYGSKDGLLEAIFDDAWQQINSNVRRSIRGLTSPREKLQALAQLTLKAIDADPDLKLLMLLEGRRIRKNGRRVMLDQSYIDFVALLDQVLLEMRSAGQLRRDVHPQAVRSALIGVMEGLMRDLLIARQTGFRASYRKKDLSRIFALCLDSFSPSSR